MDKFRAVWEKVDAALFQILRHICAVILGALVAVVFYIFFGRYVLHNSPMWGEPGVFLTDILSTVCVVGFSIFLIVYGIKLAQQGANNNMAGINVPYSFMYSALPVTGMLNIFAVMGHWVLGRKESK